MFRDGCPGNANLLIGAVLPANREIGVPENTGLRGNIFKGFAIRPRKLSDIGLQAAAARLVSMHGLDSLRNYRWSSAGKSVETSLDAADTSVRAT